jgi:hypothetical protein
VPEILEVELTRRAAAGLVGRRIDAVERTDPIVVADGVDDAVPGATIEGSTVAARCSSCTRTHRRSGCTSA